MQPYSHYIAFFSSRKDPDAIAAFMEDARNIADAAPNGSDLCGKEKNSLPVINNDLLIIGSDRNDAPFSRLRLDMLAPLPKKRYPLLAIVQTDRHPYDIVICACILSFLHHFPSAQVTTDGNAKDWAPAVALYEYATSRLAPVMEFAT